MNKIKFFMITTLLIMTIGSNGFAQYYMNPQSVAFANTFSTKARGSDVIGWNPANLGLNGNPKFSIRFGFLPLVPLISMQLSNNSLSPYWFNEKFLTGKYLDDEAKEDLLSDFSKDGLCINPLLQIRVLDISSGRWAVSIGQEVTGAVTIPKSLFHLMFFGNEFGEPVDLSQTDVEMQSVSTVSLAHGREIAIPALNEYAKKITVGGAVKLLVGTGYVGFDKMEGKVTTYEDSLVLDGDIEAKYGVGGFGFALDAGVSAIINDQMMASFSLNNLFGFVSWGAVKAGKAQYSIHAEIMSEDFDDIDSLLEESVNKDTTFNISRFTSNYPSYMLFGFQYKVLNNLDVFVNYRQFFQNEFASTTTPNLGIACEYRPLIWLPLRTGISVGGLEKFQIGFGLGLKSRHYTLDMGISQTGGIFNHAKGFAFSFGQSFVF